MIAHATIRNPWRGLMALAALALFACGDENPFRNTTPQVTTGEAQVWELGLPAFPSGWDFPSAQRIFLGTDEFGSATGTFFLDARADGTLVFRPFSTFLAPGLSGVRAGIRDLGSVPFESVEEVPEGGYSDVNDSTGVAVQQGHVYAFRISRQQGQIVPINYAKLEVVQVGSEIPGEPRSRFVRFRWAYQLQPLNRRVAVE
ncbi:MAG TPA: hypothetical protein VMR66_04775 [Gemmatimonadota bacterium]|nr:hypothetical protein [Gemmatimonadota bacterium]